MKRVRLVTLLILLSALLLTACGGSGGKSSGSGSARPTVRDPQPVAEGTHMEMSGGNPPEPYPDGPRNRPQLGTKTAGARPSATMADGVDAVLAAAEYVPEMFFGELKPDDNPAPDFFPSEIRLDKSLYDGVQVNSAAMTYRYDSVSVIGDKEYSMPVFTVLRGEVEYVGNTLLLYPLSETVNVYAYEYVQCTYSGETVEYGFTAIPNGLRLERNGLSCDYHYARTPDSGTLGVHLYLRPGTEAYEGFETLIKSTINTNANADEKRLDSLTCEKDGSLLIKWTDADGKSHEDRFAYLCGRNGFIDSMWYLYFTDGQQTYSYVVNLVYNELMMLDNLEPEQAIALEDKSEAEVQAIADTHKSLRQELEEAFAASGLNVQVDEASGAIRIDSSLLYDTNAWEVTETGKAYLKDVFSVYCSILGQDAYRDFVSYILIEGHTDSEGTYEYNLELSQKRADAVRDFCLSPECGIEDAEWLEGVLRTKGCSYDRPLLGDDGKEDKDASRRVELRFFINVD